MTTPVSTLRQRLLPARRITGPITGMIVGLVAGVIAGCGAEPAPPATTGTSSQSATTAAAAPSSGPAADPAGVPEQLRFSAKTLDGQDFDGASLGGKRAVLWFWAPWCPKCRAEAGGVASIARDSAATVTFVGVAAQDEVPAMQAFVRQYGVDFTHLADTSADVWRRFGVTVQPAYAFVTSSGTVEVVKTQLSRDELAARVAALS